MSIPTRIQRRCTKGWRMPENTVYVGRPTIWGNHWKVGSVSSSLGRRAETAQEAVDLYRKYSSWSSDFAWVQQRLRGKNLCCSCALDQPCHADVLLEIANGEVSDE